MTDLVYPPIIGSARAAFLMLGLKFTVVGAQNVPTTGGAVLASNHVSYLDFIFVGLGADDSKRLVRFMAKDSVFKNKVSGPLMRGCTTFRSTCSAGADAYDNASTRYVTARSSGSSSRQQSVGHSSSKILRMALRDWQPKPRFR